MSNLLLVEDDPILGKGLKIALEIENYKVVWVDTLEGARNQSSKQSFDLIILDLNLPDGSGLTLAKECKNSNPELPILMLTASNDEESVIAAFDAGAIDYVRKPFSSKELNARIRVILKNKIKSDNKTMQYNNVVVLPNKRLVQAGNITLELNRREFDIFCYFIAHAESVVTRESLLRVLDKEGEIFDRTIDSHVSHLRSRLRHGGITSIQISSVYGIGYRLEKKS